MGYQVKKLDNRTFILNPYPERKMILITVKLPVIYVEGIDELVKQGRYSSRSELIRTAIRDLLKKELWDIKYRVIEGENSK